MEKFRKAEVFVQDISFVVRVLSRNVRITETIPNVTMTHIQQQQKKKPKTISFSAIGQQAANTNRSRNCSSNGS